MIESVELLKKLQVRSGLRLWLVDVPAGIAEALTAGAEIQPVAADEPCDGAIVFCRTPAEVAALAARVTARVPADGLIWFCYRKGGPGKAAGLTRDRGWEALTALGYAPVRSISIDDEWTGLRFREGERIRGRAQ